MFDEDSTIVENRADPLRLTREQPGPTGVMVDERDPRLEKRQLSDSAPLQLLVASHG